MPTILQHDSEPKINPIKKPFSQRKSIFEAIVQGRYDTLDQSHIETVRQKLAEHGIHSAVQLMEWDGLKIGHLAKTIGAQTEIRLICRKPGHTITLDDLMKIGKILGRNYREECKHLFGKNGIRSSIDVYNMSLDIVMSKIDIVHRYYFVGYRYFDANKTREQKKTDLIKKLDFNPITDVKRLLQRNKITNTISFIQLRNKSIYDKLRGPVINKILGIDELACPFDRFTLMKQLSFCKSLGRFVSDDIYQFLKNQAEPIEGLFNLFGKQSVQIIEHYIMDIAEFDEIDGKVLYNAAIQYARTHKIKFIPSAIARREKAYILIMFILGSSFKTPKSPQDVSKRNPGIITNKVTNIVYFSI